MRLALAEEIFLPKIRLLREASLELLFPATCSVCGVRLGWGEQTKGPVCTACWGQVRLIQPPICSICGQPLSDEVSRDSVEEIMIKCSSCKECSPVFSRARSIFYYEGPIRHLIHEFKYRGKVSVGKFLARSIVSLWDSCQVGIPSPDCIVPVPIGIKKLRQREFNQSLILARQIGKLLKVPVYPFALKRVKEVAPQMKLSREERMRNVQNAFQVRNERKVCGRRVLLVDDVFTTGATARECSLVLRQKGVREVSVLTLARSVLG